MKKLLILLLILFSGAHAEVAIKVIYPRANQQIALVDSEFIFGNVPVGSKLWINGQSVPVYSSGGWLTFLAVSPGPYVFHLVARKGNDSSAVDWPIVVGAPEAGMPMAKYIPKAPYPSTKAMYFVGDTLEFSFSAPAGGVARFSLDGRDTILMYQSTLREQKPESVFGNIHSRQREDSLTQKYVGYYRFAAGDTGVHSICYEYANPEDSSLADSTTRRLCLDSIVTVKPDLPPVIGIFSGQSHIIRTAPGMGFKLLYQPPGIMARVIGMRDKFYKIALAPGVSGFVPADSVTILPPGTTMPEGVVSYLQVDPIKGGAVISTNLGAKVPYQIEESLEPQLLDIDFFGVTGSVDFIRYNNKSPLVKIVKWSQPQDHVFRVTVEIGEGRLWGYKASYDVNKFMLQINELARSSLKGLKIAIDPGHSKDPGAVGPTGLEEADANLWIAQKLRVMLEKSGAKVMMTRSGHENVALYDRPAMADKWGADLLVSIHNNALPDGIDPLNNNGTSAYYYFPQAMGLAEAVHREMVKATGKVWVTAAPAMGVAP